MKDKYPFVLDRVKSILIDGVIVIGLMLAFTEILNLFENVPNWVRIILFISIIMYEPLCTTFGATLGNHKMEIRVRKSSDESKKINIFQAIIRFLFKGIFGWFSFITVFVNPKKRAIHDLISGSVMIKV